MTIIGMTSVPITMAHILANFHIVGIIGELTGLLGFTIFNIYMRTRKADKRARMTETYVAMAYLFITTNIFISVVSYFQIIVQ